MIPVECAAIYPEKKTQNRRLSRAPQVELDGRNCFYRFFSEHIALEEFLIQLFV